MISKIGILFCILCRASLNAILCGTVMYLITKSAEYGLIFAGGYMVAYVVKDVKDTKKRMDSPVTEEQMRSYERSIMKRN